ncbi:MAG TPA: porin family protein, partial [Tenuifilaceae bacterium]|nr:porin family protein [Tenuifilaceae bacterium]
PELMFSQAGCKFDADGDPKLKLNYIVLPIIVKYSFGAINLQAGPQLGFLLSAEDDGDDIKEFLKPIDLGLNIGAGYQIMENLGVEARYNLGLSNIVDEGDGELKTNGIQVLVSYSF